MILQDILLNLIADSELYKGSHDPLINHTDDEWMDGES